MVKIYIYIALSDNAVWLEGLAVFYPIFEYLEANVPLSMLPAEFHRRVAFVEDINFYADLLDVSGQDNCTDRRPSIVAYLDHLAQLKAEDPRLLWAFVYHLYMGLLSGGQILQKKRRLAQLYLLQTTPDDGDAAGYSITNFGDYTVGQLKMWMRQLVDDAALGFDIELKERLIEESKKVFELNNEIVRSVKGVQVAGLKKIGITVAVCVGAWLSYKWASTFFGGGAQHSDGGSR